MTPSSAPQPTEPPATNWVALFRLLRRLTRRVQAQAALAVGIDANSRIETVERMLDFNQRRAPGYWIQLVLASGIAILGLVLDSTAVVIGAMLVSPLMGPLVELGMGFAIGSSYLVIRSALRVVMSVVVVVLGTAFFTMVLPFHEVTREIGSRTSPTALDLMVAIFCALTAAYTTVRQTSDTTAAAAGTAIGIALVPPLCVIGYGLGTANGAITSGSALLFTANFSAILVFAVLSFLLLGYDHVDAGQLEAEALTSRATRFDRVAARSQEVLQGVFGSRYGPAMRILVPLAFLAAVYFPLSSALEEVTWQVQKRTRVTAIINEMVPAAVQQKLRVENRAVEVQIVVVGDSLDPVALESRLATSIAAATGVEPVVNVVVVPDIVALGRARGIQAPTTETAPSFQPLVEQARSRLGGTIARAWPLRGGRLAGWSLQVPPAGPPIVVVHHFGPAIGASAEDLLTDALAPALDDRPIILDQPLDSVGFVVGRDTLSWLVRVDEELSYLGWLDRVEPCIQWPAADSISRWQDSLDLRRHSTDGRVRVVSGSPAGFRWTAPPCTPRPATTAGTDPQP